MDLESTETADVDRLAEWPLENGMLGLRIVVPRSTPKDELRLEFESKWPDLFSFKVAVRLNVELSLEMGIGGRGGKLPDTGDTDGGGLALLDFDVEGRSTRVWSFFDCKNALKTVTLFVAFSSGSPKVVEFWFTYLASVLGGAF
jgi:hypothetical protein